MEDPARPHIRIKIACFGILLRDGRVLLMQHNKLDKRGLWGLPGGNADEGETFEQALVREVEEETGIAPTMYENAGKLAVIQEIPNAKVKHLYLLHAAPDATARIADPVETLDLQWVPLADVAALPQRWPWLPELLAGVAAGAIPVRYAKADGRVREGDGNP